MLVAALSTGHKLGLGLMGLAFIVFALSSSFLFPRFSPNFPGGRLRVFLVVTFAFFIAMLAAVEVFGKESEEAKGGEKKAEQPLGKSSPELRVNVTEVDFKIKLGSQSFKPGAYTFEIHNTGKSPHNLAIVGPGEKAQSPTINPGQSTTLKANLKKATYDFFCAVPGHKQLGMDVKVKVS